MESSPLPRCGWATSAPLYIAYYYDEEWGRPVHDDRHLFEMLSLEGAQAGLSWITILKRREGGIAGRSRGSMRSESPAMGEKDVKRLMVDAGIIRNRAKIESTIKKARAPAS